MIEKKLNPKIYIRNFFFEKNIFFIGIFLLPSAPGLSVFFLIYSLLLTTSKNYKNFFKDKTNIYLCLVSLLMIISCLFRTLTNNNNYIIGWDTKLDWLGIFNWIPLFWCFWGSQNFLKKIEDRKKFSFFLISGTLPVIISGIGQYFFSWHGPFQFLDGFIIWFQKPIYNYDGLSGLFSNANYAGLWLSLVFPFCLINYLELPKRKIEIIFLNLFTLSIFLSILLTYSKNAWLGLFISIPIIFGGKTLLFIIPLILFILLLIVISSSTIFAGDFQLFLREIIPESIWKYKFKTLGLSVFKESPRISIWSASIKFIIKNPVFGYGTAAFPLLYAMNSDSWYGHTHNILIELALSYGIPCMALLSYFFYKIISKSFVKIFKFHKGNQITERAWYCGVIIIITSHMFDLQYYDLRINIIFWTLLAGLKKIADLPIK